jgi:hypothetical protein
LKLRVQNSESFSSGALDSLMALSPKTNSRVAPIIGSKQLLVVGEIEDDEVSLSGSMLDKYEGQDKRSETQVGFAKNPVRSPVSYNRNYMKTELKVHN